MNRYVLCALATALLTDCSSSAPPLASYQTLPQTRAEAVAQHLARHGRSWVLPGSSAENLVYVSNQNVLYNNEVDIFSYPQGKLVGQFTPDLDEIVEGMCSDPDGNVWILGWETNRQDFYDEYAHGGTYPVATLSSYGVPNGCAVDPKTKDLAVANFVDGEIGGNRGDLAVYTSLSGKPTDYYGNTITHYYYCAYDNKSNLFGDGDNAALNELPNGGSSVRNIYLNRKITPGSMQWDGKYVTVAALGGSKGATQIDRISVEGSSARIVGATSLKTPGDYGTYLTVQFAIADGGIIGPGGTAAGPNRNLYFWPYPGGGLDKKSIAEGGYPDFYGVAFSAAPKAKR